MKFLSAVQDAVLKQKEEAAVNKFSRVSDFREFITAETPAQDVTVAMDMCCLSAERLKGGPGTRVTGIDASQRAEFEPTTNALVDLTPLRRKPFIVQVTVWDGKPKNGSFGKANLDFRPGTVYTFRNVDGVGFYAEIAERSVQYECGVNGKVFELHPPLKKRKTNHDVPRKGGKAKLQNSMSNTAGAGELLRYDSDIAAKSREDGQPDAITTRSKGRQGLLLNRSDAPGRRGFESVSVRPCSTRKNQPLSNSTFSSRTRCSESVGLRDGRKVAAGYAGVQLVVRLPLAPSSPSLQVG